MAEVGIIRTTLAGGTHEAASGACTPTAATAPARSPPCAPTGSSTSSSWWKSGVERTVRVLVREGLFTDGDPPALLGGRCTNCANVLFPPAETCPYCATEDPEPWSCRPTAAVGLDGGHPASARVPGGGALRLRRGGAARGTAGRHPPDRGRPGRPGRGSAHAAADRAAAPRRGRQGRGHLRLRAGGPVVERASPSTSPASASTPSAASTAPMTDMGVAAVRAALGRGGRRQGRVPGRLLRHRLRRGGDGAQGAEPARHDGHAHRRRRGRLRQRRRRPDAGGGGHPGRAVRHRARVRVEKMPRGIIRSSFFEPWQEEAGLAATPAYFALRAQRLMPDLGGDQGPPGRRGGEEPAPRGAQPRRHVPVGGRRRTPCWPRGWCASRCTSGCCARPTRGRPPWSCAAGRRSADPGHGPRRRRRSPWPPPCCARTSPAPCSASRPRWPAWPTTRPRRPPRWPPPTPTRRPASARPTSTWSSARTPTPPASSSRTRSSGCASPAESAALLDSGATALGGRLPVNPSGGLLSKGEPLGASALGQVVELVRQLRGECGPRQVEGARVALAHTVGRGANAGVVILTR